MAKNLNDELTRYSNYSKIIPDATIFVGSGYNGNDGGEGYLTKAIVGTASNIYTNNTDYYGINTSSTWTASSPTAWLTIDLGKTFDFCILNSIVQVTKNTSSSGEPSVELLYSSDGTNFTSANAYTASGTTAGTFQYQKKSVSAIDLKYLKILLTSRRGGTNPYYIGNALGGLKYIELISYI